MKNFTDLEYAGKSIRFDDSGDRVWVSLTDMRKATNQRVDDWIASEGTKFFLRELDNSENGDIFRSVPVENIEWEGVWAIDEAAIDFAAWCDRRFRLWVSRQIRNLTIKEIPIKSATKTAVCFFQSLSPLGEAIAAFDAKISTQNRKVSKFTK